VKQLVRRKNQSSVSGLAVSLVAC
jgi:hypothetical protein